MNQQFEDEYGYVHSTTSEISRGGQGVVFRTQNPNIAVKILISKDKMKFNEDLSQNKRFEDIRLFPVPNRVHLTLPQATLKNYAGYVMTLLADMESFENAFDYAKEKESAYTNRWLDEFKESVPSFANVMGHYVTSGGRRRRLLAYLKLAVILSVVHSKGLVYCDISGKNAFISSNLENNEVWLIDADNLDYQENCKNAGCYTPGYGAPEVLKGKRSTFYSDSYAFSVSLFWQLTGNHPFKGALMEADFDCCFVDELEEKAYAGEFPWIMDEDDNSNEIDAPVNQHLILSDRLKKCFSETFSENGKKHPSQRPTMFEWSYLLAKELDLSVKCPYCEMDYDASFDICPWCDTKTARVILTSSVDKNELWQVVHELPANGKMAMPMRLIRDFRVAECEKTAFSLEFIQNRFVLSDLSDMVEWSVSTDNGSSFQKIYGSVTISGGCLLQCGDQLLKRTVLIEVLQT